MSSLIKYLKQKKKVIIIISLILLIPFIIPIVELLIKMIYALGNYVGTNIRYIVEGKMC